MDVQFYLPNAGRMPALETLPTHLQSPIKLLKQLPGVAGVLSGCQAADRSTTLFIDFTETGPIDYDKALQCFANAGLSAKSFRLNRELRFMQITVIPLKILLN